MRTTFSLLCLLALLICAAPAQAQLRADLSRPAPAAVYDSDAGAEAGFGQRLEAWMGTLFSDDHFRMAHSYEMSMSSFNGGTSLGMYTNTMQWQFGKKWAARADVSVVHQPFGGTSSFGQGGQNMRVILRNAEVAYRPSENMEFRFRVQQSPYGRYARPRPYGYGAPAAMGVGRRGAFSRPAAGGDLFWKRSQRN